MLFVNAASTESVRAELLGTGIQIIHRLGVYIVCADRRKGLSGTLISLLVARNAGTRGVVWQ